MKLRARKAMADPVICLKCKRVTHKCACGSCKSAWFHLSLEVSLQHFVTVGAAGQTNGVDSKCRRRGNKIVHSPQCTVLLLWQS